MKYYRDDAHTALTTGSGGMTVAFGLINICAFFSV